MPPKKAAAKHAQAPIRDQRRAYEHLGRIQALQDVIKKSAARDIDVLTELASKEAASGHHEHAANLLRAAEHIAFGSLETAEEDMAPELEEEIRREFESKLGKADDHWDDEDEHLPGLEQVFASAREHAHKAVEKGHFRRALEYARGAEALSHLGPHALESEPA